MLLFCINHAGIQQIKLLLELHAEAAQFGKTCAAANGHSADHIEQLAGIDRHKEIAHLERRIRKNHIKRMNNGECTPLAGVNFIDLITPCTRITDHALNLVEKVLENQI